MQDHNEIVTQSVEIRYMAERLDRLAEQVIGMRVDISEYMRLTARHDERLKSLERSPVVHQRGVVVASGGLGGTVVILAQALLDWLKGVKLP